MRKFGFYPDLKVIQPGDLVLVCPTKITANALIIQKFQQKQHVPYDAQWIHAAAYLGENSIVEIDQGGVGVDELHKYVGSHKIQVRRPLNTDGNPVDILKGYMIAVSALKMFKTTYGFNALAWIAQRTLRRGADYRLSSKSKEAICSDYYNDAVARVLGRGAVSAKINPFTPADLSASTNMEDVVVEWLRLPAEA